MTLEASLRKIIEKQADEIENLKARVTRLESREEIVVAKAQGAAAAVAATAAAQPVSDISRRLGALEEQLRQLGNPKLSPPA